MSADEDEARHGAMVDFLTSCFTELSGSPPSSLSDLSDGVVLFEALSEIAPDHFDASTVARDLGDNWALKASNLRKLLRNLETYYQDGLGKSADFELVDVPAISRTGDPDAVANLVELIAGAAVSCEERGEFVGRIMAMESDSQLQMKGVIEAAMARMVDVDDDDGDGMGDGMSGGDGEIAFDSDDYDSDEDDMGFGGSSAGPMSPGGGGSSALAKENEDLKRKLSESQQELAAHKSRSSVQAEDLESAQRKLRALTEDLQERLDRRQDELTAAEDALSKSKRSLEDAEARVVDLEEKSAQLADELDVASAKATQLLKAEATVVAYRKKLEGVGVMSQQLNEMEDQSASYLRKIMELESDVKKVPGLQRSLEESQKKLGRAEKNKAESDEAAAAKAAEAAKFKSEAQAAEAAKKMYEEELAALRAQAEVGGDAAAAAPVRDAAGDSFTSSAAISEQKEKYLRLKIENDSLREQIEQLQANPVSAVPAGGESSDEAGRLRADNGRLRDELRRKETEKAKLASDKEKLEAYTKKTLSKFQEKYLVALQECKAKLKEKHDKIEALEQRSASEKTAQKREERLLSSTIYELGLAIMQQKLKERS